MRPEDLEQVLLHLKVRPDPRVLAGQESPDDAVVFRMSPDLALVQTVDFFTPVVDDPRRYGRVAAANSLSDVYAMGATPLTAMNVVCFPTRELGPRLLGEILQGGLEKVEEAGAVLAGGHTVEDAEPKYGLAVTGVVHPDRIVTKGGARPGDRLVLTKPIGTGVLTTAHKRGDLPEAALEVALEVMERLNAEASRVMVELGARGGTDITGYGLVGHALELARASRVGIVLQAGEVPVVPGAWEALERGHLPGGSRSNRSWVEGTGGVGWAPEVSEPWRELLCDAQTSGGLLVCLPEEPARLLVDRLRPLHGAPRIIGRVVEAMAPAVQVVG